MLACAREERSPQQVDVDEDVPADAMLLTGRVPTDGANCRGGLSAIPSVGGLGLEESCELALDIGLPDKRGEILPRFGALES